jgi:tetratricopeptide (TPR) repeat protein
MRWGDLLKSFLLLVVVSGFLSCASKEKKAEAHFRKGFEYQNQGNLEQAIEEYQKALELNPDYAQVHTNLGTVYLGKEDYDGAIGHFRKTLELNYYDSKAHYNLGLSYVYKGELEKAKEEMKFLKSIRSELGDALEKKIEEKEKAEEPES